MGVKNFLALIILIFSIGLVAGASSAASRNDYPLRPRAVAEREKTTASVSTLASQYPKLNTEEIRRLDIRSIGQVSVRVRKVFVRFHIRTIGDLLDRTKGDLLGARNFGRGSLNELKTILTELNEGTITPQQMPIPTPTLASLYPNFNREEMRKLGIGRVGVVSIERYAILDINTIGDLLAKTEDDLLNVPNFLNKRLLEEVKRRLTNLARRYPAPQVVSAGEKGLPEQQI